MAVDPETTESLKHPVPDDQALHDAEDLAHFGHSEALTRKFSLVSMLSLSLCVLGTWSTFAQGFSSGFSNGGPVAVLWGLCLVTACNLCVALSMGELVSSMPTALGQAYWISRLWPTAGGRFFSYLCAWINTFGWWTLSASQIAFMTNMMLGMKVLFDPEWPGASKGWVQLLLYVGITFTMTLFNIVSCRRDAILPMFNNFVGVSFVGLFFVICLALLISVGTRSGVEFQSAHFVFRTWINQTGWEDGVTWFMGLVQAAYGLTAFDSAIHMVEEIPSPRTNVPRIIWLSVTLGAVSGFIFLLVCLFCIQDLQEVLDADLPFMNLVKQAVGLDGAAVLLSLFIASGVCQGVSIVTTASRMTWGFARDGGIPWSDYFAKVDETWKSPVRALWLQGGIMSLVAILYTFSSTTLDAIVNVSTIALTLSYMMPILVLLYHGRDKLPPGKFSLGWFGPIANWVSIFYCAITSVFFFFPGTPNPTGSDMNYAIAVFGVMMIVTLGFWVVKGRVTYLQSEESEGRVVMDVDSGAITTTGIVAEKQAEAEGKAKY